jgi:hypothetical protein
MQRLVDFGATPIFPSTVGGLGGTVKYFPRNTAYGNGATWLTNPGTPSSSSPAGFLAVPGNNQLDGQNFTVFVGGNFLPAANATSETVTVGLYGVTGSTTSPSYTLLASTGAYAPGVDGIYYSFGFQVNLLGDSNSGVVGGNYLAVVNGQEANGSPTNTVNTLTGINFNTGNPGLGAGIPFGLVVGVTFGASNVNNSANLYQFSLEA